MMIIDLIILEKQMEEQTLEEENELFTKCLLRLATALQ